MGPLKAKLCSVCKGSSAGRLLSHCDSTAGLTVPLFCFSHGCLFVISKEGGGGEKKVRQWVGARGGCCSWSQGLQYGNLAGPGGLDLGERLVREQGVPLEPGGLGLGLGLGRPAL